MGNLISGISSMATRQLLAELAHAYRQHSRINVGFESVGGVDAAQRVAAGEPFDVAVLASDAIDKLIAGGSVLAGSRADLVRSPVAITVRAGAARPDVGSEDALRRAVLAAGSVGYSTGPSGTALLALFQRWGIAGEIRDRLVKAPAGVPVAKLVADGTVGIGFQQLSEMLGQPGIVVVGAMPAGCEIVTTFSGGVCATSTRAAEVGALLAWLQSPATAEAKRQQGMDPA
jgi:molybdate transport system substrate-binding protein